MEPDRRNRISDLYHAALERAPEERSTFLKQACEGDEGLREEVESLLGYESASSRFLETPAAAVVASAPGGAPMLNRQIGSYTIVAPLGSGGMGEVYRARDTKLGRDVAIKILPSEFTADPERRARFAREARLLATLNHPHIGAIYGLEEAEGVTALVLELVEGATLADRLERGPLTIPEALTIAHQIADALDEAHEKGIVHRDLKPANIVLQGGGGPGSGEVRAKVLDFGLAKTLAASPSDELTKHSSGSLDGRADGRILGTPAYMSPEQARGLPVDKRTDVWAFGCVLFEMLTGQSPFGGQMVTDTLARILEREPEWASLPDAIPPAIRTLMQRCLRKDPEKRLHDIADARIEIDDQDLVTVSALDRTTRRVPPLAWIAATLLVSGALAAAAFLWLGTPPPAAARLAHTIGPPENARFWYRAGPIALAPDGGHLAVAAATGNRTQLWVRSFDALEWRAIQGTEGARIPFWKADSREIGFFANGKLKAVPVREGGIPYDICDAPEGYAFYGGAAWNRDDVIIFMSRAFRLQKVSAKSGVLSVPVTTLQQGETSHRWPSFLPDGQHFLYLALRQPGNPGELHVGSLDGAAPITLGPSESNALYSHGHVLFVKSGQLVARPFDASGRRATGDPFGLTPVETIEFEPGLGSFANFSAADSRVVAYRASGPESKQLLTWRDRNGRVVGTVGAKAKFFNLDLSPDGNRLAVSTKAGSLINSDIWIADLRTGISAPLTTDTAQEYDPRWSRDGNWIAFISNRTPGRWSAFRRPSNGSGTDEPLIPADSSVNMSDWTPDGRSVLYTNGSDDLWVLPLDGTGKAVALRRTEGRKQTAVFSPNGHWIAYGSEKSGRREIYVRAFPDGEVEHKVSQEGGVSPRWSADGKEIFFLSPDATMMAARVDTLQDFKMSAPEPLFPTGLEELPNNFPYAVARDGRFLMPMPVDPRAPAVTVLWNWQEKVVKQ